MTMRVVTTPPPPPDPLDRDATRLFDYAMANRAGFTREALQAMYSWDQGYYFRVARRLRATLAGEKENLVCTPDPDDPHGPWTYRLTGDAQDIAEWETNRLRDSESRLITMVAVAASQMKATDARTTQGKKARVIFKGCSRVLEDLRDLQAV